MKLLFPIVSQNWLLDTIATTLVSGYLQVRLYQRVSMAYDYLATLSTFQEANYDGYSPVQITSTDYSELTQTFPDKRYFGVVGFTYAYNGNGISNVIDGYYLTWTAPGGGDAVLVGFEEFQSDVSMVLDGDMLSFAVLLDLGLECEEEEDRH